MPPSTRAPAFSASCIRRVFSGRYIVSYTVTSAGNGTSAGQGVEFTSGHNPADVALTIRVTPLSNPGKALMGSALTEDCGHDVRKNCATACARSSVRLTKVTLAPDRTRPAAHARAAPPAPR